MVDPFELISSPSDCALLVAVPLTAKEFETDVAAALASDTSSARGDYAFGMARNLGRRNAWIKVGKQLAELFSLLIEDAQRVGFRYVSARATANCFEQAFGSGAKVVLLVAHWRDPEFVSASDVRTETRGILEKLAEDSSDKFLGRLATHRPSTTHTASDVQEIRFARDWLLDFLGSFNKGVVGAARDELDCRLSGCLVPGNCLELRDGYHKAVTLANRIPARWGGIIDLGVCNSMRLALSLKEDRTDRAVISNEHAKYPDRLFIPSFYYQMTPKISLNTRCSISISKNLSINGRTRSSDQLGIWSYNINP